jgi:hypothetical protein
LTIKKLRFFLLSLYKPSILFLALMGTASFYGFFCHKRYSVQQD